MTGKERAGMPTCRGRKNFIRVLTLGLLLAALPTVALAALQVQVLEVNPTTAIITSEQQVTITWKATSSDASFTSGDYRVELGGNGTSGSGTLLQTGTVTVDIQVAVTLTANQIGEVNDTYTVFIIVTSSQDVTDTNFTAQTVTLYNPPEPPTGVTVEGGDGRLIIEWTQSPNENIDHYNLYYGTISRTNASYPGYYNGGGKEESPVNAGNVSSYVLNGLDNGITYYVTLSTVDTQGEESASYSDEKSGTPAETYGLGDNTDEPGGCFIATAAFGGPNGPQVKSLRIFRDRVLAPHRLGRFWVHRYYQASPPVARVLAQSPQLQALTRGLLAPVVWAARLVTPPADPGREKSRDQSK